MITLHTCIYLVIMQFYENVFNTHKEPGYLYFEYSDVCLLK